MTPADRLLATFDAMRAELELLRRAECLRTLAFLAFLALHVLELAALALWLALR